MKKRILTLLLSLLMLFSVCLAATACQDDETPTITKEGIAAAIKLIETKYKTPVATEKSYTVNSSVRTAEGFVKLKWTVVGGEGAITLSDPAEDGTITVNVTQKEKELSYTLKITLLDENGNALKDENGKEYTVEIPHTVPAKTASGTLLDQFMETVFSTVEVGKEYNLGLFQKSSGKVYYATGALSSKGYLETTTEAANAAKLGVEAASEGYYVYFVNGTAKNYISLSTYLKYNSAKTQVNPNAKISLTETPKTAFTIDEANKYLRSVQLEIEDFSQVDVTEYTGEDRYFALGTYSTYTTISVSNTYYLEGTNESKIDNEQFVARLCTAKDFDYSADRKEYENKTELTTIDFDTFLAKIPNKNDVTTEKFAIKGWISSITSLDYGNGTIVDKDGKLITVYGLIDNDNNKYKDMTEKPVEGDFVILYGIAKNYSGTKEIVNAVVAQINDKAYPVTINGGSDTPNPPSPTGDPVHAGTEADPYTIADAIIVASKLESGACGETEVYVKGYLTEITYFNETYKSYSGKLADAADATGTFELYSGVLANGITEIKAGDLLVIKGRLKNFNGTYEIAYDKTHKVSPTVISVNGQGSQGGSTTDPEPAEETENKKAFNAAVIASPVVGTAYKWALHCANDDTTYFFVGEEDGGTYKLKTSKNVADAVDVYLEEVEGGYRLYFMKGEVKTYVEPIAYNSGASIQMTTAPTQVLKIQNNVFIATVAEGLDAFMGGCSYTNNSGSEIVYSNIRGSKASYLTSDAAKQYPAMLVDGSKFTASSTEPEQPDQNYTLKAKLEFNSTTTAIEGAFVGDTSGQVWNYNGIKVTAEKNQSNTGTYTDVTDHARFYKGNSFKVEYTGMSKIVLNCTYADKTGGFTGLTLDGATATVDGKVITIIFTQPTDVFSVAALANQIRVSSIEIYALA